MANLISNADKKQLYLQVKTLMGYPTRKYKELSDEALDTLFLMSLEEYQAHIQNWLVEQQWGTLQGTEVDGANFVYALTTKTLDWEYSFTHAYTKQIGIGGDGPWELKKDYITVSGNCQVYSIPAGREINEILWSTPPVVASGGFGGAEWIPGQNGWQYQGLDAAAVLPAFGMILAAQDRLLKRRILMSELSYRITAGPKGTKLLHLYPLPGSHDEMPSRSGRHSEGTRVWYWYYDINNKGRKKCLEQNDDIIKLPDDVPLQSVKWDKVNTIARTRIRKLLYAKANTQVGTIRGQFSGEMSGMGESDTIKMDYQMYLDKGKETETALWEEVDKSLEKISNVKLMEDKASIAENLNRILKLQPLTSQFMYG
jgi:hypothetical protein